MRGRSDVPSFGPPRASRTATAADRKTRRWEAIDMSTTGIDEAKLEAFMGQAVSDMGAIISAPLMVIGEKLGLYKAMAGAGPLSSQEVAERSGAAERYVREWLGNQAAGGYVTYDPDSDRYTLPDEHALALADEDSPFYILGVYDSIASLYADEEQILEAFRSGEGMGWHEHDHRLFRGTERFFRPGYKAHLVAEWIPALDGVQEKLQRGAKVADVGCGHGASTIIMAEAFPDSEFFGFDYHEASIARAREAAEQAGVSDRVSFAVASAKDFPGGGYDLVCVFDCLHDMGDPAGAASHIRETLAEDGTWMIVEPFAGDRVQDNLNPIGRVFYGASTVICTPASLSQEVGLALGAQAGETRLAEVIKEGGFSAVRRATETPFNLILEAKP
jgi:SAM-dependent methyltransferase